MRLVKKEGMLVNCVPRKKERCRGINENGYLSIIPSFNLTILLGQHYLLFSSQRIFIASF